MRIPIRKVSPVGSLRTRIILRFIFATVPCLASCSVWAQTTSSGSRRTVESPEAKVALGHELFFDSSLSADGTTSCASCHKPATYYDDGRPTSRGVLGRKGTRNTPSLLTVGDHQPIFWDGRRDHLDQAVLDPFLHPGELGLLNEAQLIEHLQTPNYRKAFVRGFGVAPSTSSTTLTETGEALAAFVNALPRPATSFDRYRTTHDPRFMSSEAIAGMRLFSGSAGCSQCHRMQGTPTRFSDNAFHSTGTGLLNVSEDLPKLLHRQSTQTLSADVLGREIDTHADIAALGRFAVTHRVAEIGLFRTPSLRYVANTAPYMHDGSVATLEEAVDQEVYWRGRASGQPLSLTVSQRGDLIAFLRALSIKQAQLDLQTKPMTSTASSGQ